MKTQKRQVTITDLYNLVAHETVSLLEAVDDDAIPPALEMRKGLTMLATTAVRGKALKRIWSGSIRRLKTSSRQQVRPNVLRI